MNSDQRETAFHMVDLRRAAPRQARLSPPQTITLSFGLLILAGALLLCLPIASRDGQSIGFLNALFTATSATCVTGLIVVNTLAHWTWFGKLVILALIQLGGLGIMTVLTLGMVYLRRRISLRNRLVIQASFNQDSIGGMVRLVRSVVRITLAVEGVGAVLLAVVFYLSPTPTGAPITPARAAVMGVFHAISSFCNAGFDIIGPDSLVPYQSNYALNAVIMLLITLGGLGFPVIAELLDLGRAPRKRPWRLRWIHLSLHSKLALLVTAALTAGGALLFLLLEWQNPATLGNMNLPQKGLAALFQSVTLRTCGYNSIPQDGLTDASQFVSAVLMVIGGSPASTAGGLKTVTLGVVFFAMVSAVRGRDRTEAFGRTLPIDLLQKALTVASILLTVVLGSTLILHFTEQNGSFPHTFLDLLYECASAAGTVGVTTGLTPHVSVPGRLVLIACMFLGRLGPITVAVSLHMRSQADSDSITYPDERVIIG